MATKQVTTLRMEKKFKKTPAGEIPVEWEAIEIQQACEILDNQRVPLNNEQRQHMKGDVPYYGANGVVDYINKHIFDEELVLIAEDGGYFEEFKTRPIAYLIRGKSWVNNHAHVLRCRRTEDTHWIYYTFVHKNIIPFIKGGTRSKLNQEDLRRILVQLPPEPERDKIAEILSSVDEAIEKTDAVLGKTKQLKKGLMQKLLTCGLGHKKFKKTELGEIPAGWEVQTLEEIASIRYGLGQPPKIDENGVPMIRATNIKQGKIINNDILRLSREHIPESRNPYLKARDIIVVRSGVNTGDAAIVTEEWEGSVAGYYLVVSLMPEMNAYFYLSYLLSEKAQRYFSSQKDRSAQSHLNSQQLSEIPVPIPSVLEQNKIAEILLAVDDEMSQAEASKQDLEKTKKSLMQVLLSGKVRVNCG